MVRVEGAKEEREKDCLNLVVASARHHLDTVLEYCIQEPVQGWN